MRKIIFVLLIACVACVGCGAKEAEARSRIDCSTELGRAVLNDCAYTEEDKMEIGVGTDVKLWEHEKFVVDQETRLDLNSGEVFDEGNVSTYTVFKPKMEKGLLQVIGDFFAGLFDKE